jgi:hypothetical protein
MFLEFQGEQTFFINEVQNYLLDMLRNLSMHVGGNILDLVNFTTSCPYYVIL